MLWTIFGYSLDIVAGRRGRQRGSIDPPVAGGRTSRFLNQSANRAPDGLNAVSLVSNKLEGARSVSFVPLLTIPPSAAWRLPLGCNPSYWAQVQLRIAVVSSSAFAGPDRKCAGLESGNLAAALTACIAASGIQSSTLRATIVHRARKPISDQSAGN